MQEEQAEQAEATEEPAAAADTDVVDAVDQQAAASDGATAEAEPEVPDDASATIAAAQEHIDKLDMDQQRSAAKKAT